MDVTYVNSKEDIRYRFEQFLGEVKAGMSEGMIHLRLRELLGGHWSYILKALDKISTRNGLIEFCYSAYFVIVGMSKAQLKNSGSTLPQKRDEVCISFADIEKLEEMSRERL